MTVKPLRLKKDYAKLTGKEKLWLMRKQRLVRCIFHTSGDNPNYLYFLSINRDTMVTGDPAMFDMGKETYILDLAHKFTKNGIEYLSYTLGVPDPDKFGEFEIIVRNEKGVIEGVEQDGAYVPRTKKCNVFLYTFMDARKFKVRMGDNQAYRLARGPDEDQIKKLLFIVLIISGLNVLFSLMGMGGG